MKYFIAFVFSAALACAYIQPPDQVLIDGRIVLTGSTPLQSYPWPKSHPRLSEHPAENISDSRELESIWEIEDQRLYLLAVSAYKFEPGAPLHSLGLRDLMPERMKEGKVFADWFTGDFVLMEQERVDLALTLLPQSSPAPAFRFRKLKIVQGRVVEEGPNLSASEFSRQK